MKVLEKILKAIILFSLGTIFAIQVVVHKVIAPGVKRVEGVEIEPWLAVYNLYDHVIPYLMFFVAVVVVSFIVLIFLKVSLKKK